MQAPCGEYSDALLQILLCFVISLLLCFASRFSATASGEGFSSPGAIRAECRSLLRDGCFKLRASGGEDCAAGDGSFADGRKPAPPHRRNRRACYGVAGNG